MRIEGKTILVTGGASGIGHAFACRFHDLGAHVIVAGRRRDALDRAIAGRERMSAVVLDVGDAGSIAAAAERVVREHPALDMLVNNAGIMCFEEVGGKRDLADAEATIATNLLGPIRLIDALVDHLAGKADAVIINVSSGLAYVPLIAAPTYCATKAAIHSYTVTLREALKSRIEVIELVPPGVQTDLTPGQSKRPGYMPLDAFVDEAFALLRQQPTPPEILVEKVALQRFAEREGRFAETLKALNEAAAKARQAAD